MLSANKKDTVSSAQNNEPILLPDLNKTIAELAYYKSESRGFAAGYELDDWLAAERELTDC